MAEYEMSKSGFARLEDGQDKIEISESGFARFKD